MIPNGSDHAVDDNVATALNSPNHQVPSTPKTQPFQQPISGKVLVLNGFPGTGKLTILEQAKDLLPADRTCVLDIYLLIDPVEAVIPGRSEEHHELRRKVRGPIFEELRKRTLAGHIILMTACLVEGSERDDGFFKEHLDLVRDTDVLIYWINTLCDQTILEQRGETSQRR